MVAGGDLCIPILDKIGTFLPGSSMSTSNMKLMGALQIKLCGTPAFSSYFRKMAAVDHFNFPIFAKIYRVLLLWVTNGCVKYKFDMVIGVTVT